MAALDFPASPAVNDEYTANGRTWRWNGETWRGLPLVGATGTTTLDFPPGASVDDFHTHEGWRWQWNGESWRSYGAVEALEPWGEVARQETLSGGALTITGLDLSGIECVQFHLNGLTVTTDDSQVLFRYIIGGVEISTGYFWSVKRLATGLDGVSGTGSDTSIHLTSAVATNGVGNAATEGFDAVVTVFQPAGSLHKRCHFHAAWSMPDGTLMTGAYGGGQLNDSGAITGVKVFGSSDLTGGTVIALGVE
jgi:hypothetical protein